MRYDPVDDRPKSSHLFKLKLTGALVTTVGGAIALFGEPRIDKHLTTWGYVALASIVVGLVVSIATELLQMRAEHANEATARHEERLRDEWHVIERHPLASVQLSFFHRHEMTARALMEYLGEVSIQFNSGVGTDPHPAPRVLRLLSRDSDAGAGYALGVGILGESSVMRFPASFYRKATADELAPKSPPRAQPPPAGPAPNVESAAEPRSRTSEIISVTHVYGNEWAYTTCQSPDQADKTAEVCGVRVDFPWSALSFGSACHNVSDLGVLNGLTVLLPACFDLARVDDFSLAFSSSAGSLGDVSFEDLRFGQRESDDRWEITLSGPQLYEHIRTQYLRWRSTWEFDHL